MFALARKYYSIHSTQIGATGKPAQLNVVKQSTSGTYQCGMDRVVFCKYGTDLESVLFNKPSITLFEPLTHVN